MGSTPLGQPVKLPGRGTTFVHDVAGPSGAPTALLLHGLGATARLVADPLVRNRGTVCGSLAHADPQGDWGSALLAARASAVVRGAGGERTVPVEELALGPFMTTLAPDEVITEVRVPDPGPRASGTYLKLERKVGDFATAAVGVQVSLDNGHIAEVGIGLTGVGATNVRAKAAEDSLRGAEPTDDAIREAAELAAPQQLKQAEKESAAITGFTSAIAAYGAFFIPKSFGSSIALSGRS